MSGSELDVARLRRETPGTQEVIHLNNAGAALMPQPVLDAVIAHLQLEARIGGYEAADAESERIEGVYRSAARLIGAAPDEIAVVENATRAWDMAFYSIPFQPGDRILTSRSEYASNVISFLQVAQQRGASVEVIPSDESGQVDVAALERMLDARVKLIAVSHVPTNGGLVQPAEAIGRVAREAGVLYLLDACQSVGQLPVDVGAIGCDLLSATSRKYLRGPRGVGFLYARRDVVERLEPPFLDLHAARWLAPDRYEIRPDARRFENWETNYAAKLGMGVAIEYALGVGIAAGWRRLGALAEHLRAQLMEIPGVQVHDLGQVRGGIVTFSRAGVDSEEIKRRLAAERINVTTSSIFSTRFDMSARNLGTMVRASTHYYNTEDELARLLDVVEGLS